MDPRYGERYRDLYQRHWWWRAREKAVLRVLRENLPRDGQQRILDVGCGDGLLFNELLRFGDVEGLEPEAALLDPAGPHRARIHLGELDASFRPGKQYSALLMLDVLEHLPEPAGALRHAAALLAPGGVLLLTVPAFRALWTQHDVLNHHVTRYRRSTLLPLVTAAGFEVKLARYYYHWMFPAKLATRATEAITRAKPSVPRVPPAPINQLLYFASRLEQPISRALPIPFGNSLLVLATKK
jgi:2-polyprenyl-3-methyl-5-hydroxy-6-metoxy-1,4-benzoquinol methylase